VYHGLQAIDLHGLVKSTVGSDIRHDLKVELCGWVEALDRVGFLLRADSGGDFVTLFEKDFKDVSGDKASPT